MGGALAGNASCAAVSGGLLCGTCQPTYHRTSRHGCKPCPRASVASSVLSTIFGVGVFCSLLVVVFLYLHLSHPLRQPRAPPPGCRSCVWLARRARARLPIWLPRCLATLSKIVVGTYPNLMRACNAALEYDSLGASRALAAPSRALLRNASAFSVTLRRAVAGYLQVMAPFNHLDYVRCAVKSPCEHMRARRSARRLCPH